MPTMPSATMNDLPDELISRIFEELPETRLVKVKSEQHDVGRLYEPSSFLGVSSTSKRWHNIAIPFLYSRYEHLDGSRPLLLLRTLIEKPALADQVKAIYTSERSAWKKASVPREPPSIDEFMSIYQYLAKLAKSYKDAASRSTFRCLESLSEPACLALLLSLAPNLQHASVSKHAHDCMVDLPVRTMAIALENRPSNWLSLHGFKSLEVLILGFDILRSNYKSLDALCSILLLPSLRKLCLVGLLVKGAVPSWDSIAGKSCVDSLHISRGSVATKALVQLIRACQSLQRFECASSRTPSSPLEDGEDPDAMMAASEGSSALLQALLNHRETLSRIEIRTALGNFVYHRVYICGSLTKGGLAGFEELKTIHVPIDAIMDSWPSDPDALPFPEGKNLHELLPPSVTDLTLENVMECFDVDHSDQEQPPQFFAPVLWQFAEQAPNKFPNLRKLQIRNRGKDLVDFEKLKVAFEAINIEFTNEVDCPFNSHGPADEELAEFLNYPVDTFLDILPHNIFGPGGPFGGMHDDDEDDEEEMDWISEDDDDEDDDDDDDDDDELDTDDDMPGLVV